jgi:hypothetical protein
VPVENIRENPAEEHTRCAPAREPEADYAHRLRPFCRLGEEHHQEREGDRGDDRAAQALHRTRADEKSLRRRQPARERGEREERDAGEEEPARAEQVAEPAAEQEEAAEREQVGVDYPGKRRLREAEVVANRRKRDIHDRPVEHDHEIAEADHIEREPACPAVHGHGLEVSPRCWAEVGCYSEPDTPRIPDPLVTGAA